MSPKFILRVQEAVIGNVVGRQAEEIIAAREGYFTRIIATDAQPYRREITVGKEWTPLKFTWDDGDPPPSQLIILNEEGVFRQGIPTPETKAEVFARIVEIACEERAFAIVRPLQSIRIEPTADRYFIRCRKGKARVTVASTPGGNDV